jgi:hypothetical protein
MLRDCNCSLTLGIALRDELLPDLLQGPKCLSYLVAYIADKCLLVLPADKEE